MKSLSLFQGRRDWVFWVRNMETGRKLIGLLVLVLFISLIPAMPLNIYAADLEPEAAGMERPGGEGEFGDGEGMEENIGNGFLDAMLDTVFGMDEEEAGSGFSVYEMLEESIGVVNEAFETMTDTSGDIGAFYYMLKAVALTIMSMYFIMGLAGKDFSQQFGKPTVEMLAKPFAKFIVCMFLLACSEWLMKFFLYLSQWCFNRAPRDNSMAGVLGESLGDYKALIYDAVGYVRASDKSGLGIVDTFKNIVPFISVFVAFMLPWLISLAASLVSVWVVYSRTAQIIVMALGAPLAMSDLYGEHPLRDTRAFQYIKEFAGVCFQSVVIAAVFIALNMIMAVFLEHFTEQVAGGGSSIGNLMAMGLKIAVFKLVQVGLIVSSGNRAKKMMAAA
ncbi:hypothetical protein D7X87_11045 [bacterium D16-54]|nr:hypothetical protein D7X87_11045 [bacterium D16-54]RKJ14501.1 hypothetical protein D7X65_11640 [bacterium D16-56]